MDLIDCPGSIEFAHEAHAALMVADIAIVVCEPSIDRAPVLGPTLKFLDDHAIPHILFVKKIDIATTRLRDLLSAFQGVSARPLALRQVPILQGDAITGYVDLVSERAYRYRPGKHQNTIEEINSQYVNENGIHVVRRISGGGAVYHDTGNLNFSFMTRYSHESIHNFRFFTGPVIKVLAELGVNAELNGRNDITVSDRKISGNAQFTDTKSMFSHGTLLFDSHLEDVVKALNVKTDKIESKGIKSVRSRVANISEFLSNKMSIDEFRQKIINSIFSSQDSVEYYDLDDGTK